MNDATLHPIQSHPDYQRLVSRKQRLTAWATLAVLTLYYGFTLLLAFAPGLMARPLGGESISLGLWLAVAVIVLCFALTAFFVHKSNQLDPLADTLKKEFAQ